MDLSNLQEPMRQEKRGGIGLALCGRIIKEEKRDQRDVGVH